MELSELQLSSGAGVQSLSGHWEANTNEKHHFCTVSGGYVCIGTRLEGTGDFSVLDAANCEIEKFQASGAIRNFVQKVSKSLFLIKKKSKKS